MIMKAPIFEVRTFCTFNFFRKLIKSPLLHIRNQQLFYRVVRQIITLRSNTLVCIFIQLVVFLHLVYCWLRFTLAIVNVHFHYLSYRIQNFLSSRLSMKDWIFGNTYINNSLMRSFTLLLWLFKLVPQSVNTMSVNAFKPQVICYFILYSSHWLKQLVVNFKLRVLDFTCVRFVHFRCVGSSPISRLVTCRTDKCISARPAKTDEHHFHHLGRSSFWCFEVIWVSYGCGSSAEIMRFRSLTHFSAFHWTWE